MHVVARSHGAIGKSHTACIRIGQRGARLLLPGDLLGAALGAHLPFLGDLVQRRLRLGGPCLGLPRRPLARCLPALRAGCGIGVDFQLQIRNTLFGSGHRLIQAHRALERALARRSLDLRPVDNDLVDVDQPLGHECCQTVGQQLVEHIGMGNAEVAEAVMVDRNAARQPAVGQVAFAQTVQLARRANALDGGEQPQRKLHRRIGRRPAGLALARRDLVVKRRQIERRHEAPHQPGNMIGGQPGLWIDQIPRQLRTIGPYHTSPAPHIASCVRHVRAPRIDPLPRESQLPSRRWDFFTSS